MKKLVKQIKLNNLEYNANRDPAVYRRCANESFRIQAMLDGSGAVECSLTDASGAVLHKQSVSAPGTYSHELSFPTPGIRVVTLNVSGAGQNVNQSLRLDVLEHAWHG